MEEKPIQETAVNEKRTWSEEIEIASGELVDFVKRMIAQGNVRRLIISRDSGEKLLEIPLTAGVIVGGALTLFSPVLAALGALAALVASVKVEVIRVVDGE
jgi:hypothetical protein